MPNSPRLPPCSNGRTKRLQNSMPACKRCVKNRYAVRNPLNKDISMNAKLLIGVSLALALGACVSTPQPNAALVTARSAVQSAEADPNVSKYAALDLEAAKKDLEVAESAAINHREPEIAQPAYLATQTARLAQAHAAAKADDARVAAGQAERDRIQLAARTRDVDNAKMATSAALGQRDQATEQAARLQAQGEKLKGTRTPRGVGVPLGG